MGFTKLDSGIVNSSIWSESLSTRIVWITILAMSDENGFVSCSYPGLQRAANIPMSDFTESITILESPDKYSRTSDFDGKRIQRVEGGWIILNFMKYRERSDVIREQTRERVKRYREKNKNVTQCNVTETLRSVSVSESVSDSSLKEVKEKTFKNDYKTYLSECTSAYEKLLSDQEWISQQERYNPNVDIKLSLEKMFVTYWGTEAGWKQKKTKRVAKCDWTRTFTNGLSMASNKVYKPTISRLVANKSKDGEFNQTRILDILTKGIKK